MNIDKYTLCLAQSQARIARFLKNKHEWNKANQTLKQAYSIKHQYNAKVCKEINIPMNRLYG
ncbi:host cell division inhibitory peptide Kil [Proteus sp. G2672]|uniref:host cell division inhibitory peptide Kil n=1 Tax=Pseudomonas sp. FME51 TaxID=2742609 RepID=UPI00137716CF|nr:host cell division inhibitory peptide Kil [Pseudomonas sp. FME51]NBL76209.1 host cell division inhibitory peptide Kil [Proteus sp. G2672]